MAAGLASSVSVDLSVINVMRFSTTQVPIYYNYIYTYLIYIYMYADVYLYINIYRTYNSRPLKTQAALNNKVLHFQHICTYKLKPGGHNQADLTNKMRRYCTYCI